MALKDTWVDKIDGVDINSANDINQVAQAVIEAEEAIEEIKEEAENQVFDQIQSDYTQNDSTAKDYIKNRPFYEGEPVPTEFPLRETIFAQQTLNGFTYNENFGVFGQDINILSPIVLGETYKVVWDDEEYIVTAQDTNDILSNSIAFGDLSLFGLAGNNEPFVMVWWDGALSVIPLTDTEAAPHNVAIYKKPAFTYRSELAFFGAFVDVAPSMYEIINNNDWKTCVVNWDDEQYICEPIIVEGTKFCGNVEKLSGTGDSGEPFVLFFPENTLVIVDISTPTNDTNITVEHDLNLFINMPDIKKIDKKFLPDDIGGGLPEVTTDDNGKFLQVVDGVWTAVALTDVSQEGA